MFSVRVDSNLKELVSRLEGLSQRRINSITASTLTAVAAESQKAFKTEAARILDRPRQYTINATFVSRATAQSLTAKVGFKESSGRNVAAGKYLLPEIYGGVRAQKRFERALQYAGFLPQGWLALPGPSAKIDSNGNIPGSEISRILSGLRGTSLKASMTTKKKKATQTKGYFAVKPGSTNTRLSPGVYEYRGEGHGRRLLKILNFVSNATYNRIFPIGDIVSRTRDIHFNRLFAYYLEQSLARKAAQQART